MDHLYYPLSEMFVTFDHSFYSIFFKIIIYFICDLKHNFSFFIFEKKLNKTIGQTLQVKTQNSLYCGT